MSAIVLDTSAYSAFKRGHPQLRFRLREASRIHLNPVVLGELRAGFLRGSRPAENLAELEQFMSSPRVEVAMVNEETASRYALIVDSLRRAGTPIPTNDIWIAASAMHLGAVLVTTDPHFGRVAQIAVEILEPLLHRPGRS